MISNTPEILVLYYSQHGSTQKLANQIATGIEQQGCLARIRTVPSIMSNAEPDDALVSHQDLYQCQGLAMGSPTRFGQMSANLKVFWDSTSEVWLKGALNDKPACVFSSSSSLHGGQESTLLAMMLPLLHHGMLIMGIPYAEPALHTTQSGGSPYGATHLASHQQGTTLTGEEKELALALGKRLASTVLKLSNNN